MARRARASAKATSTDPQSPSNDETKASHRAAHQPHPSFCLYMLRFEAKRWRACAPISVLGRSRCALIPAAIGTTALNRIARPQSPRSRPACLTLVAPWRAGSLRHYRHVVKHIQIKISIDIEMNLQSGAVKEALVKRRMLFMHDVQMTRPYAKRKHHRFPVYGSTGHVDDSQKSGEELA